MGAGGAQSSCEGADRQQDSLETLLDAFAAIPVVHVRFIAFHPPQPAAVARYELLPLLLQCRLHISRFPERARRDGLVFDHSSVLFAFPPVLVPESLPSSRGSVPVDD